MKAIVLRYAARFDALNARERLLVFAAVLAGIGFALQALMIEPAVREAARLGQQLAQQEKMIASIRSANQSLLTARNDPDASTRTRIEQGKRELAELTAKLDGMAQGLVPPDRMTSLLEGLLGTESRLSVVELKSLAPTPLTEKPKSQGGAEATAAEGVFKHGIELTAQGSYSDLYGYVTRLEKSPLRMYWSTAALDASAYPRVRLTLRVYTVSTDRSWMRL